jgi:hypothetical protein
MSAARASAEELPPEPRAPARPSREPEPPPSPPPAPAEMFATATEALGGLALYGLQRGLARLAKALPGGREGLVASVSGLDRRLATVEAQLADLRARTQGTTLRTEMPASYAEPTPEMTDAESRAAIRAMLRAKGMLPASYPSDDELEARAARGAEFVRELGDALRADLAADRAQARSAAAVAEDARYDAFLADLARR